MTRDPIRLPRRFTLEVSLLVTDAPTRFAWRVALAAAIALAVVLVAT